MTAVSHPRSLESLATLLQETKIYILKEAAAAICVVHIRVSREIEAAISLKMVILVY